MKNIHILPTVKPSRLHFTEEELVFTPRYEKLDGVTSTSLLMKKLKKEIG